MPDSSRRPRSNSWRISRMPCIVSSGCSGCTSATKRALRDRFAHPRVVLHRAGAEEADIHHALRFLRQMQVVALHFGLGHFRQLRHVARASSFGISESALPAFLTTAASGLAKTWPRRPGTTELHDDRLVPDADVEIAQLHFVCRNLAHHITAFSIAAASLSMSSLGMNLGHAVKRALAERRNFRREILAAEDLLLAQRRVDLGHASCRSW